jgi:hypothetical protein
LELPEQCSGLPGRTNKLHTSSANARTRAFVPAGNMGPNPSKQPW